jgi:hypothetical protein
MVSTAAQPGKDKPKLVGPSFWLERGAELRLGAVSSRVATAKALSNGIAWFWSAYTALGLVGVALSHRKLDLVHAVCFASPTLLLLAAYGASLWAQSLVAVTFIPQSPASVEKAHEEIARRLKLRLIVAAVLTSLAALAVAGAFVFTATTAPDAGAPRLSAVLVDSGTPTQRVLVTGVSPPGKSVLVELGPGAGATAGKVLVVADQTGRWSAEIPYRGQGTWSVSATWKTDPVETRLRVSSP